MDEKKGKLPKGWKRFVAPTGHYYYYNKITKQSTYDRPIEDQPPPPPPPPSLPQDTGHLYEPEYDGPNGPENDNWQAAYTPGFDPKRAVEQPVRKRKRRQETAVLCRAVAHNWMLVVTNLGRPFFYDTGEKKSVWIPPDEVKTAVDQVSRDEIVMMIARARGLKDTKGVKLERKGVTVQSVESKQINQVEQAEQVEDDMDDTALLAEMDSTPYTGGIIKQRNRSPSVSGTEDDSSESDSDFDSSSKKATDNVEFDEDDIEWQIAAMMQDNPDLDLDDYEDEIPYADKVKSFTDLLVEADVNPYSPWDLEMPKLVTDPRYKVLETTSERKAAFENWSRDRIAELKGQAANTPKVSPEQLFSEFLRQYATPRLFYQEFKRKYRKEPAFKESRLSDREREKMYREFVKKK
ncbi:hypothetical protein V1512DRAFT_16653 [Lipomyces arxii]|uniref:uncharacterized protein n=1 Tax=Lipomyces arxii TaxID=56418 RepID=UPI0034CED4F4